MSKKLRLAIFMQNKNKKTDLIYRIKEFSIRLSIKHVFGLRHIDLGQEDVVLLCLVKNGEQWIADFINHYFKIGVKHIVFLDNMSSDKTIKIAKGYKNITVLQTDYPFFNGNCMRMRDYLIKKFAYNKWSLLCDIDEFFDYPFSDIISLNDLIKYLNVNNYTAVVTYLCDMYPEKISRFESPKFNREVHKFYDDNIDKYPYFFTADKTKKVDTKINIYEGGIRKRLFETPPYLTKHALIHYDKNTERAKDGHYLLKGRIADFSAVLFHYKFVSNFYKIVEDAIKKEQYAEKSKYYKEYHEVIKNITILNLKHKNSQIFKNISELIDNKFLIVSKKFNSYVKKINDQNKKAL